MNISTCSILATVSPHAFLTCRIEQVAADQVGLKFQGPAGCNWTWIHSLGLNLAPRDGAEPNSFGPQWFRDFNRQVNLGKDRLVLAANDSFVLSRGNASSDVIVDEFRRQSGRRISA